MHTITLSGWGQPADALSGIAPHAQAFSYASYPDVESALAALAAYPHGGSTMIGWSLGGLLLSHAVARGIIAPKKLVLVAAPYQFVASPEIPFGMPRNTYTQLAENFAKDPKRTLTRVKQLVAHGDEHEPRLQKILQAQDAEQVLSHHWRAWYDALDRMTHSATDWTRFPETLLIHGDRDVVVNIAQSRHYAQMIPHTYLEVFEGAAHAPHWHDAERLKALIARFDA